MTNNVGYCSACKRKKIIFHSNMGEVCERCAENLGIKIDREGYVFTPEGFVRKGVRSIFDV